MKLDVSFPYFVVGGFLGLVAGLSVTEIYRRRSAPKFWIEILAVTLLFGIVGAIFGFLTRRFGEDNPPPELFQRIAVCAAIGLVLGYLQWLKDGRRFAERERTKEDRAQIKSIAPTDSAAR